MTPWFSESAQFAPIPGAVGLKALHSLVGRAREEGVPIRAATFSSLQLGPEYSPCHHPGPPSHWSSGVGARR
eukprot:scaffold7849_cov457-Prasinococcus_capsulatus_cf.AAC.6